MVTTIPAVPTPATGDFDPVLPCILLNVGIYNVPPYSIIRPRYQGPFPVLVKQSSSISSENQ